MPERKQAVVDIPAADVVQPSHAAEDEAGPASEHSEYSSDSSDEAEEEEVPVQVERSMEDEAIPEWEEDMERLDLDRLDLDD